VAAYTGASIAALMAALIGLGAVRSHSVPVIREVDPPRTYRIAYRVDEAGKPTRLQLLTVRRPFDGRNETSDADGTNSVGIAVSAGHAWRLAGGVPEADLGPKAPSTPPGDSRPLLAMGRAIRAGLAKQAGHTKVAGRTCTRYAVAEPLGKPLSAPGPISRTELCVDRRGLVLEERWTSGRKLQRLRRAVDVQIDPSLTDEVFFIGRTAAPEFCSTSHPDAGERSGPAGFAFASSCRVGDTTRVEAWTRGPDLLLIEHISGSAPWGRSAEGTAVTLGAAGSGRLVLDLVGSQLRISPSPGRYLRLSGSVSPDVLLEAARNTKRRP
jgi:hypothetical protein